MFVGDDYDCGSCSTIVPANMIIMSFGVVLHNDTILERSELFSVMIRTSSLMPDRIIIGNTNVAVVVINDTSGKQVV